MDIKSISESISKEINTKLLKTSKNIDKSKFLEKTSQNFKKRKHEVNVIDTNLINDKNKT
jgi:2C-methyl-D-erythritol 2,4-cyclodiphosphate synthase